MNSLWISEMGLRVNEKIMETISNNISNINTTGYKFQDVFLEELNILERGNLLPCGVNISAINKRFTQGELIKTNNPFDFAINGNGFFRILLPDETIGYIRAGEFNINADGFLVTKSGLKIFPEIIIPDDAISFAINEYGEISIKKANGDIQKLGVIELANFINVHGLKSLGSGIYVPTEASGEAIVNTPGQDGLGLIKQGFVEKSNVELVNELIKMILIQRSYEINAKVIQTIDTMMSIANSIKR